MTWLYGDKTRKEEEQKLHLEKKIVLYKPMNTPKRSKLK